VNVMLNLETTTVRTLEERILKGNLNMIAPDVEVEGKGIILISSEEGETEGNNEKFLKDLGIVDGSILTCDDFFQSYNLKMYLYHADKLEEGQEFILTGDKSQLQPKKEEAAKPEAAKQPTGGEDSASAIDVDEDVCEVMANGSGDRKRPAEESNGSTSAKKPRVANEEEEEEEIMICEERSAALEPEPTKPKKGAPLPAEDEDGVVLID